MITNLLFLHLIISLVLLILILLLVDKGERLFHFVIVLTIPILGYIFFIVTKILSKIFRDSQSILDSYQMYIKDKSNENVYISEDIEQQLNIIPLEDALVLNEDNIKRKLMLDILKDDYKDNIDILKSALNDKDSETSHYAAAALMSLKSSFDEKLKITEMKYINNYENLDYHLEFIDTLKEYLESDLLDKFSYKNLLKKYSRVIEKYLNIDNTKEKFFKEKILTDIELKDYNTALIYCDLYNKIFYKSEWPYILYLKIYYILRDRKKFKDKLKELINSDVIISHDNLEKVRFWIKGDFID